MKIILKSRWINGENVIMSACPVSEALFQLLENRNTLRIKDLRLIAKMGFEMELVGDRQPLANEMSLSDISYKKKGGNIVPEI
jgi:hypothetical protein